MELVNNDGLAEKQNKKKQMKLLRKWLRLCRIAADRRAGNSFLCEQTPVRGMLVR